MDNTRRFDGKGAVYAKARPRYAAALFDHIRNRLHVAEGSVFADIGSGTGIFSEQLLRRGYRVYAVEPNAEMRQIAEERLLQYPGFTSAEGADSHTGLPDHSVDLYYRSTGVSLVRCRSLPERVHTHPKAGRPGDHCLQFAR